MFSQGLCESMCLVIVFTFLLFFFLELLESLFQSIVEILLSDTIFEGRFRRVIAIDIKFVFRRSDELSFLWMPKRNFGNEFTVRRQVSQFFTSECVIDYCTSTERTRSYKSLTSPTLR